MAASPGAMTPEAKDAEIVSIAPAHTGVPSQRPVDFAALLVTSPTI